MKEVLPGEIYEFGGVHHLVLQEDMNCSRKMFWCSLDGEGNIDNLLKADNYGLVTPREEWKYVSKVTDSDYKKTLENFCSNVQEHWQSRSNNFTKRLH